MGTPGLEGKFDAREGLQSLLAVPEIGKLHGVLPTADFLQQALNYASQRMEAANAFPEIAKVWKGYATIASQLLSIERQRTPILASHLDADSRMRHDHETGKSYIVVGGGPQEGGYDIELNPNGENRMIQR